MLNSTAIRVRWSAPLQSQGGRIRGYVVFYTKVDDLGKELIPPEQTQVKFTASEHQLVSKLFISTNYGLVKVVGHFIGMDILSLRCNFHHVIN